MEQYGAPWNNMGQSGTIWDMTIKTVRSHKSPMAILGTVEHRNTNPESFVVPTSIINFTTEQSK